ncbi:(+)-neomenthol dehydrogenase [Bienertia sinuspersici]
MAQKQEYERIAVVTGANKGIGFEIVRQLAAAKVTVILTARDEGRGVEATSKVHNFGLSNVVFHQLDVTDINSITFLVHFVEAKFGTLDILVNNAGNTGVEVDEEGLRALNIDAATWISGKAANLLQGVMRTTYEKAEECFNTNYYGTKRVTEALLPLLKLSTIGARIVNISSLRGELWRKPNDEIRTEFTDIESLTEEKIHDLLQKFLHDVKQCMLTMNGWPLMLPAYGISKTALNAYTRLLARKYPDMYINCVHPGYVDTDLSWHTGPMSPEDGAKAPVRLALLPEGGPSGCYFDQNEVAGF